MGKSKTIYVCQECGATASKWMGKCSSCGNWNTFVEEIIDKSANSAVPASGKGNKPILIRDIAPSDNQRINTRNNELNRILGGGLVTGSVILIGGEPGIGKSTLALQLVLQLNSTVSLYVSGEESAEQVKLRAERLNRGNGQCYFLNETSLENIIHECDHLKPGLIIIDSIQTITTTNLESSPGSVSQVRECSAKLQHYAKSKRIPVVLIGHINKEGHLAGPKVMEHIVDTVLQFEGDQHYMYRILRATKNRFGSTAELGIFEMQQSGLVEIPNPSEILLSTGDSSLSGIAVAVAINGSRPLLIETQALVSTAAYGTPQRSATGFDAKRLNMLLAVLEKRAGFHLSTRDVFLNIAGGLKIQDPATDLAVICAVLSSSANISIDKKCCFSAEISLSGEIRPVNRIDQRILEAEKLGFEKIFIAHSQKTVAQKKRNIEIVDVKKVEDIVKKLFS